MRFVPSRSQQSKARDGPERTWCDGSLVIVLELFQRHRDQRGAIAHAPLGRFYNIFRDEPRRSVLYTFRLKASQNPLQRKRHLADCLPVRRLGRKESDESASWGCSRFLASNAIPYCLARQTGGTERVSLTDTLPQVIGEGNLARSEDPVCQVDDTAVWQLTFSFLVKDRLALHYLSARAGSSLSMYRPMNS
jgi:hypothetical protein